MDYYQTASATFLAAFVVFHLLDVFFTPGEATKIYASALLLALLAVCFKLDEEDDDNN